MASRLREGVAPAYLFLCLVLGGSAQGIWANMVLQLLGIGILAWAALAPAEEPLLPPARQLLILALLAVALVALQLVPLPASLWPHLPGRHPRFGERRQQAAQLGDDRDRRRRHACNYSRNHPQSLTCRLWPGPSGGDHQRTARAAAKEIAAAGGACPRRPFACGSGWGDCDQRYSKRRAGPGGHDIRGVAAGNAGYDNACSPRFSAVGIRSWFVPKRLSPL